MHAGWASRVYFSDNGSTAIEIALKMAFRKFCVDHDFCEEREEEKHIVVKVQSSCMLMLFDTYTLNCTCY